MRAVFTGVQTRQRQCAGEEQFAYKHVVAGRTFVGDPIVVHLRGHFVQQGVLPESQPASAFGRVAEEDARAQNADHACQVVIPARYRIPLTVREDVAAMQVQGSQERLPKCRVNGASASPAAAVAQFTARSATSMGIAQ